jgi:urease accessory protein
VSGSTHSRDASRSVKSDIAWIRLLQLASPALPVGAYSYSQGLEQAVDAGVVHDEATAQRWIADALAFGVAGWEAPAMAAAMRAWQSGDDARVGRLDREFVAGRECAELRAETVQMGHSLARLLGELAAFVDVADYATRLRALAEPAYPTVWAAAAAAWSVPDTLAVQAYLWAWLENQAMAAVKLVPLGQSAGQRLLATLGTRIPALAREALSRDEQHFCNWTPGLAIASAVHETQYSRLFRS